MVADKVLDTQLKRIIWAIDPLDKTTVFDRDTLLELDWIAKQQRIAIEPVYVFTPIGEVEELAAETLAAKILKKVGDLGVSTRPPKIIIRQIKDPKSSVQHLLDYAYKVSANLIIVSPHGRSGINRLLGSFAESLLNTSPIPLLFLNRKPRPANATFSDVLFATDLSERCRDTFEAFLITASTMCTTVFLYHHVYLSKWELGIPASDEDPDRAITEAERKCRGWLLSAEGRGWSAEGLVEDGDAKTSARVLDAACENGAGLIVMAKQTGPVGALLLGSTTKQIFLSGELPVWVYGPKFRDYNSRNESLFKPSKRG